MNRREKVEQLKHIYLTAERQPQGADKDDIRLERSLECISDKIDKAISQSLKRKKPLSREA